MNDFVQILIIVTVFLGFLVACIVIIIVNPNRVKVEAKKENDKDIQEICFSLDRENHLKKD